MSERSLVIVRDNKLSYIAEDGTILEEHDLVKVHPPGTEIFRMPDHKPLSDLNKMLNEYQRVYLCPRCAEFIGYPQSRTRFACCGKTEDVSRDGFPSRKECFGKHCTGMTIETETVRAHDDCYQCDGRGFITEKQMYDLVTEKIEKSVTKRIDEVTAALKQGQPDIGQSAKEASR